MSLDKNNPLRRQPQQKRSQERVERILDAAAAIFDEVGFEAATTHQIAFHADTAVGSLYQFFPDKSAIFHALELRHVDRVYVIWERLLRPEVVQLPFADFIRTIVTEFQQLFQQPTSRIIFVQFFTSPTIFKNIDEGFTQESIQFTAKLFKKRNPALTEKRSAILGEVCVHSVNTLILAALRSNETHRQEIFKEIETVLKTYLKSELDDRSINSPAHDLLERLTSFHGLNSRQHSILKYAISCDRLTLKNCEAMLTKVSRRTIQRDLQKMLAQKLLLAEGDTDRRYYFFNRQQENL